MHPPEPAFTVYVNMTKRFIVHPGPVHSKRDGQLHHVAATDLIRLYGVSPRECIIAEATPGQRRYAEEKGVKLIHLKPRYDGDYSLKRTIEEQS